MGERGPRKTEHNAGAFLGPHGPFPAIMRTLSDELRDDPSSLEAEQRGPAPAQRPRRSLLDRILGAIGLPGRGTAVATSPRPADQVGPEPEIVDLDE